MGAEHRRSTGIPGGTPDLLYFDPDEGAAAAVIEGLDAELDGSIRSATVLEDALAELAASTPGCVLCAYPGPNGSDPVERIRDRAPAVPTVAVVDGLDEPTVRAALEAGADGVAERPGSPGEFAAFAARVRRIGDRRPTRDEPPGSSIVGAISDVVLAVDETGAVRFANEAIERVFGYDPEDVRGRPIDVLLTDEAVGRYMHAVENDRGEPGTTLELRGCHSDGHEIPLGVTFGDWEEAGCVVSVLRDATERKRIERELDEILGRVTDAFVGLDENARVTYLNERAAAFLQRSQEELLGADFWEEFSDAVGTTFYEAYEETMETQRPVSFEEYYPPLDAWFEVNAYPSETGLSVYFRDVTERKRFERGLQSLHEATRELLYTETKEDVCELVAEVATEILDVPTVRILLFDPEDNALRPVAGDRESPEEHRDEHAWRAFIDGEPIVETSTGRDRLYLPLDDHAVLAIAGSGVDRRDSTVRRLVDLLAATAEAAFDRVEREEELRERDRALQEQTERLQRLNEVTDTMRTIEGTLVQATTREEIERAVCEKLLETERFVFAWIGAPDVDRGLVPRAWAGADRDYLDAVADADNEPAYRATETGSVTEVSNVADAFRDEPWRKAALGSGYHSALAIPLVYEDVTYGVLSVYASRPDAFDELSHEVFAELGGTIAYAINAAETRRTLLSDTVVELDLRIGDSDDVLGRLAERIGGEVEFDDDVPQPDGSSRVMATVRSAGDDGEELESVLSAAEVGDLRVVGEADDGIRCELRTDEPTIATLLAEHGARPQRVVVTPTEARAIVEVPGDTDVREFVERVRSTYPETELVARRDRDRPVRTRRELRTGFLESLTDRQEEVLRTAYLSGYFEWPRDSSGQEVAEALDIAQPTFHRHLRTGERKLLDLLLDEGG